MSYLKIRNFRLLGKRKDYTIPTFHDGLNIIHGSTDTGKSMILRLIFYALGKSLPKRCSEIDNACTHILLEIEIGGKPYTLKRDIHKETAPIEAFFDKIDMIKSRSPDKLLHRTGTQKYPSISSFMLDLLDVPRLKVPYAPRNPDKGYNSVTIKDIINLSYLSDEEVGSKDFLGKAIPMTHIKYIESLKALLKIENVQLQKLQTDREIKHTEKAGLKTYVTESIKFLKDLGVARSNETNQDLERTKVGFVSLQNRLSELNTEIQKASPQSSDLNNSILSKKENLAELQEDVMVLELKIDEFIELARAYGGEKMSKIATQELSSLSNLPDIRCPTCLSEIPSDSKIDPELIKTDITILEQKMKDLAEVIEQNRNILISKRKQIELEKMALKDLESKKETELKTYLSPLLESRDSLLIELGRKQEYLKMLDFQLGMFQIVNVKEDVLKRLAKEIEEIDRDISELSRNMKNKDGVILALAKHYAQFIKSINQTSAENPVINDKFIPHITIEGNELEYFKVSGTGKRAVLSVAYYTALFEYSLLNETFMPKILVIDGPSTGRGNNPEDPAEKVDIEVYSAMFEYWKKIVDGDSLKHQIIIVDNTLPPASVSDRVLLSFDKTGANKSRKGLIDDI